MYGNKPTFPPTTQLQFFNFMRKRHNFLSWAPDEASPYLNEGSRCAESESAHFAKRAHFGGNKTGLKTTQNFWLCQGLCTRDIITEFRLDRPIHSLCLAYYSIQYGWACNYPTISWTLTPLWPLVLLQVIAKPVIITPDQEQPSHLDYQSLNQDFVNSHNFEMPNSRPGSRRESSSQQQQRSSKTPKFDVLKK